MPGQPQDQPYPGVLQVQHPLDEGGDCSALLCCLHGLTLSVVLGASPLEGHLQIVCPGEECVKGGGMS